VHHHLHDEPGLESRRRLLLRSRDATTSSIADPELTITGAPIKVFTVFYILVGIGILVELARQLGFAYVQVRREEQAAKADKADRTAET
jgi:hypothetical protein